MKESSTATQTTASATSPIPADTVPMAITVQLSSAAPDTDRAAWQSMLERVADRISDEVFAAGGAINIGDCGRPWCIEKDFDGEGGEHARHHTGKHTLLAGDRNDRDSWWGYLLQKPGDVGFASIKAVFSNDDKSDFEIPVWQLKVLEELIAGDGSGQVWLLTEQAAGRELEL